MAARAELRGKATMDATGWDAAMVRMRQGVGSFVSGVSGRFLSIAGIIAGATLAIRGMLNVMNEASMLTRSAKGLGVMPATIDAIGDAAERTGVDAEGFISKIAKLTDSQESAILGNKQMADTFKRLGIPMSELVGLSPDELLVRVAQGAQNSATAISDLNDVMGKGAAAEYGEALADIAQNGLPAIDKAVARNTVYFAGLNRELTDAKDKFKDLIATGYRKTIEFFSGGTTNDETLDKQLEREAERLRLKQAQKEEELKLLRVSKNIEASDKILDAGNEKKKTLRRALNESLANITVSAPQAADSLARIGGTVGGQSSPMVGAMERAAKAAELSAATQEKIATIDEEISEKLNVLNEE